MEKFLINTRRGDDKHGQIVLYSVGGSCFIYIMCIYFGIVVCNTISISDDVRVT